jgi:hypothetical protein
MSARPFLAQVQDFVASRLVNVSDVTVYGIAIVLVNTRSVEIERDHTGTIVRVHCDLAAMKDAARYLQAQAHDALKQLQAR